MEPSDLTIEILKGIRARLDQTNARIDQTNARLDQTNARLDAGLDEIRGTVTDGFAEVSRRIVESEIRTSTAIVELAGTVRDLTDALRGQGDLRPRLDGCERDIAALQRRLGAG